MKNAIAISTLAAMLSLSGCNKASNDATTDGALSQGGQSAEPTMTSGEAVGQSGAPDSAMTPAPGASPDGGPVTVTDQERASLAVLNAINAHEIAVANQALGKGVSGKIADYARKMVEEHTANREMTSKMNPLDTAPLAMEQVKKGEMELQKLAAQEGKAYERVYAEAMVNDHTEALATLDSKLIPSATTPAVASHLRETRSAIATHLEEARTLQDSK